MNERNIVIIGASTGGPAILATILKELPIIDACILIVQHMPKFVNESVRNEIGSEARMEVRLAKDEDQLQNGVVFLSPSGVHMTVVENRTIKLVDGEKVNYVRPSVDVAMKSIEKDPNINTIGVIATGMGSDGAEGIRHIKSLGGVTLAQNELSCVIYGMPKTALETGSVDFVLNPKEIATKIAQLMDMNKCCQEVGSQQV